MLQLRLIKIFLNHNEILSFHFLAIPKEYPISAKFGSLQPFN